MQELVHMAFRALKRSSVDQKSYVIKQILLPQLRTVTLCFVACMWEFFETATNPTTCTARITWRLWMLVMPHALLLVAYFLQFALTLRYNRHMKLIVDLISLSLVPLGILAVVNTAFRTGVSFCCCSSLLCPLRGQDHTDPSGHACSLFLRDCHWTLTRRITHFIMTTSLLTPLMTLRLLVAFVSAQEKEARTHMTRFLSKTK